MLQGEMMSTDLTLRTVIENPTCSSQFISIIVDNGTHALYSENSKYYPISMQRLFQVIKDNIDFIRDGDELFRMEQ